MSTTTGAVALEPISLPESRDLIALEKVIERGLETFVQVGEALATIRDRRLYRTEHPTFAEYCKAKWKMSDRRARQLMDAAEVTSTIAKSGTTVPKSERQARPLAALPPAQQAEAWHDAVAASPTGTPTAREVESAVRKRAGDEPETTRTPLQTITHLIAHLWPQLSSEDRELLCNFIHGKRGGA